MDTIYIETSIFSHASARPSLDMQIGAVQHQAREWWSTERHKFELVTSQLVIEEASAGDPSAVADRLKLLDGLPIVPIDDDVRTLARKMVSASMMPQKAAADALHVAAAAVAGVQYLLTLNCKHIANAHELPRIYRFLNEHGYGQLLICTPADNTMTTPNPILDELHAVREQLLADAGGTLDALVDRLQADERRSDRPMYKPRPTNRALPSRSGDSHGAEGQGVCSSNPDD